MGLASVIDVTTAATTLLAAEVNLADAQYGVQTASVALQYAIGGALTEFEVSQTKVGEQQ